MSNIGNALAKVGSKVGLFWKANGSTVCLVGGIAGAITSGVLGARGWVKCQRIIDQKAEDIQRINSTVGQEITLQDGTTVVYTEEMAKKDISATQRATVFGIAKNLAPAVGVGAASAGLLVYGHMNLKGQVASVTAYATAIETQLSQYRVRVANKIGTEEEQMIYNGYHKEEVLETKVDPVTGEETTVIEDKIVKDADLDIPSNGQFTFVFGRGCHDWNGTRRDINLSTLSIIFSDLNDRLHVRGYVELRELCDELGIPAVDRPACETVVGNIRVDKDSHIDYEVVDYGLSQDDPEITFTVQTDGLILQKLSKMRKEGKLSLYDSYNSPKRLHL